jgi:GT2 family glycosyltransferase
MMDAADTPPAALTRLRLFIGIATAGRRDILSEMLRELALQSRLPDRVLICPTKPEDVDTDVLAGLPYATEVVTGGVGLPRQRNAIIRKSADCDAIVFFDDDFFPFPGYLANSEALLIDKPDVILATGRLLEDGIHGPGLSPAYARDLLAATRQPPPVGVLRDYYGVYGCNMLVRLDPVRRNDLSFDEALPLYAWQEDIDFSRQMAPYGRIVRADALSGVHLGVKGARASGVKFGYSQIANPTYLIRKGTMSFRFGMRHMTRNLLSNFGRAFRPEPHVDRLGRCKGNLRALLDLVTGRLHPGRILELD